MIHGDGNTRQCMATSVVAYKQAFGFDAPPYTYADFEESDVIVLVGSNLCIAHPILWQRVMRNPHQPEIIVIDPRATETAMAATQHLALYPKSDLTLLYGVARMLIERDWIDRDFIDAHTSGFEDFAQFVEALHARSRRRGNRLSADAIEQFAGTIHEGKRVSFWWTMGVNQSHQAVRTAQAIINLALMTGNIGRPGTGANSITGQCNAMGSRLFSNTTNLLGGHDFANAAHRHKVADVLGIDEATIPHEASWPYHRILEGILRGEIAGCGSSPRIRPIRGSTRAWPATCSSGSTFWSCRTCTTPPKRRSWPISCCLRPAGERRRARSSIPSAGSASCERWRARRARRWPTSNLQARGRLLGLRRNVSPMGVARGRVSDYSSDSPPVSRATSRASKTTRCSTDAAASNGRIQQGGETRRMRVENSVTILVRHGATALRRRPLLSPRRPGPIHLRIAATVSRAAQREVPVHPAHRPRLRRPMAHANSHGKIGRAAQALSARAYVEISPHDSQRLGIRSGDRVAVSSQRGRLQGRALVTPAVQPGQVFIPMHYETTNLSDARRV